MHDDLTNFANRKSRLDPLSIAHNELVAASPNVRAMLGDVHGLSLRVLRQQPQRRGLAITSQPALLRQANRGERTASAKPIIRSDRRPLHRQAKHTCPRDGRPNVVPKRVVDRDQNGHTVSVVSNPSLGDRLTRGLFDKHRIGANLKAVGPPRLPNPSRSGRPPAFVLVGNRATVAPTKNVHRTANSQKRTREGQVRDLVPIFRLGDFGVEPPPRKDGSIGHPDAFDFFQEEQALAVCKGVQRCNAYEGVVHAQLELLGFAGPTSIHASAGHTQTDAVEANTGAFVRPASARSIIVVSLVDSLGRSPG